MGGRVGGERESNSRTRPERPAQRAQAARLRPAPETGGCGGRGLCPSWIPRSGSQVSPAQAVTAQRRAPLSLKWLRYRESRPAGVRTWARAAALSRCWAAGAPSTKAWPGRGDCPRGLALAPVDPPHAGGFRASCRAGLGEGEAVGAGPSTPGLSAGLSALSGGRVSGVRIGLTQLQLRSRQGPAWRSNQREKVSNGTDVRPLTPTSRVRNQAGGAGALVVVPGAQFGASGRAARRHDRRLRIPAARRCSLPGRTQRAFTPKHPPFPGSRSAFSSSRAP